MEQRSQGPRILGPNDGETVDFGSFGVRFMVQSEESGGGFSLVEHPIPPRTLVAPLHRHANEEEYSYVLEGRMGAQLGDEVVHAEKGDFVFKPRDQWHTFWNAGDEPLRILEIISPGGFEHVFKEMAEARLSRESSCRPPIRRRRPDHRSSPSRTTPRLASALPGAPLESGRRAAPRWRAGGR